jgi:putative transposase
MDAIETGTVGTLMIAHKDRFTRFGSEWFERFCQCHACDIVVLNQEHWSPEEELVQDLLPITMSFRPDWMACAPTEKNFRRRWMPTLAHKIRLDPTPDQIRYFKQAAGTARFVWNWALDAWNRQYAAGQKPHAATLKKSFHAQKYDQFPWLRDVHRDAHAHSFADLADAWQRFFMGQNNRPGLKKKGKPPDSFYVANDKFQIAGRRVKLPKIGWVCLQESLRFPGKILGGRVVREADQWFLAVSVSVPDSDYYRSHSGHGVEGVDVGITTFATLSTGEKITGPQAHRRALRRLKMRQRAITRKMQAAKLSIGLAPKAALPQGTRLPRSRNRRKAQNRLARTPLRIANIRSDFLHKTSTRLCRENQAIGIETLSVQGMMQNHH